MERYKKVSLQFLIRFFSWMVILDFVPSTILFAQSPRLPLNETVENSARYRWEHKPVLDSLLLDDAENPDKWTHDDFGTMTFSKERAIDGKYSIRLHGKTKGDKPTRDNRTWGYCSAIRSVADEDWSRWNRLSLWIYPDLPGHKTVSVYILVVNDGGKNRSRDNIILKNQEWNHIDTEIDFLPRDKVTGVEIRCRMQGNEPGTSDTMTYYVDRLELQRVAPDHYKGWDCAPGKIAYSHTGYAIGAEKSAISGDLKADKFSIINTATNNVVLTRPITTETTYRGKFQILDFSELNEPGSYYIKAGETKSENFRIDEQIWLQPLEKALNFYYVLRTGFAVPGIHDASTLDWHATNGDKTVSLTGGWYDAGDLSQGLNNNAEVTLFMYQLAESLKSRNENPALVARLMEEANWGLDWILKTTTHDGLRSLWAVQCWWSNGIVGDNDDPSAGLGKSGHQFMKAVAAEAIAYRLLKDTDPVRATQSLKTAEEDWGFALGEIDNEISKLPTSVTVASTVIAALELYKATSKQEYADKALALAPLLVGAQERNFIPGSQKGITGFLYEKPDRQKTLHLFGGWDAHDHNQIIAMAKLCESFPNDSKWMEWYSGVAMYADLHKKILDNTAPYNLLPAGIYKNDDYLNANRNGTGSEKMHQQLLAGQPIGDNHVVRGIAAHDGHFGMLHLILAQTIGVSTAARLRDDLQASQLAEKQLEWTLGRNPFSRSLMYGEGYDYLPLYSPMNGDIVGSLPTGMPPFGTADEPYWPVGGNEPAPKEAWVQTEQLFIKVAGDLLGASVLTGQAKKDIQILNKKNGAISKLIPDKNGAFSTTLPQGYYKITVDGLEHQLSVLPGESYSLNGNLAFTAIASAGAKGQVKIEVNAQGTGTHSFALRTSNLIIKEGNKTVKLNSTNKQKLVWIGTIESANSPWYAVVVPDGDIAQRKEAFQAEQASETSAIDSLRIGVAVTTKHLMEIAKPAFSSDNAAMKISTYINETGNVVEDVIKGKTSVAVTTRNLKDYEKEKSATITGNPIGWDGLILAVSNSIPVKSLTFEQITAIWSGTYSNWKELGGPDLPIVVIGRTKAYDPIQLFCDFMQLESKPVDGGFLYREKAKEVWSKSAAVTPATDDLALELLKKTPGAITYFPLQVFYNFKSKGNLKALDFNGIQATPQTIANGDYFIHRRLNVMTNGDPKGASKTFVDFMLSAEGQKLVKEAGFLPLTL